MSADPPVNSDAVFRRIHEGPRREVTTRRAAVADVPDADMI